MKLLSLAVNWLSHVSQWKLASYKEGLPDTRAYSSPQAGNSAFRLQLIEKVVAAVQDRSL